MQAGTQTRGEGQGTYALILRTLTGTAAALVALLLLGTFVDLPLDQAINAPDNALVILLSTLGLLPMTLPVCVFAGALARRSLMSGKAAALRWLGAGVGAALAACIGYRTVSAICSADGIGPLLPSEVPSSAMLVAGVLVGIGLACLGFAAVAGSNDAHIARRLLIVVCGLLLGFLCVELGKHVMMRPRYRTLLLGLEGVEFCPWYRRCADAKDLMAAYELSDNAFHSFPSGHSVQAASIVTSYVGLSLIWPKLRETWRPGLVVSLAVVATVMVCRMILGAHFLSDVAAGALVAVLFGIAVVCLEARVPTA